MNKEQLVQEIKTGASSYEISTKFGKSQTTVLYWLKKFGLKTTHRQIGRGWKRELPSKYVAVDWEAIQSKHDAGMSWRELGYSNACLSWGVENGKLRMRSKKESSKMAWSTGKINPNIYKTKEFRKKMSKNGGYKPNSGRCKYITYISPIAGKVSLNGTWEYKYALWLDANNIDWRRNVKGFPYTFESKQRKYYPDFHLLKEDIYVEVKGYETEKDKAKWSQFPKKLIVLRKSDLKTHPYNIEF
jgi:hypothetical protein